MSLIGEWWRRASYLLNRRRIDADLRREMEDHRAMLDEPARFGSALRHREDAHDVWGWGWLDDLARDVRFAWRTLARTPGFALVAVTSLALATGATTAIFSVVNGVILRPLPFAEPDRLVEVTGRAWREDRGGPPDPLTGPVASAELEEYINGSRSFEGFAAYDVTTRHLDGAAGAERLAGVWADRTFFSVIGVEPIAGRTFLPDDGLETVVISERLWQQRFGNDPTVIGRAISLNERPFTVIGIMPERFQFPFGAGSLLPGALTEARTDFWMPLPPLRDAAGQLRRGRMSVIARLKPDVGVDSAMAELRTIASRIEATQHAGTRVRIGVRLTPLADAVLGPIRGSLWMLFAAVGLVLAAACANVANLLLARMSVRTREVVTRAALGADQSRLVRQFLAEGLLLSMAGGIAGAFIARWGTQLLVTLGSQKIPRAHEISLDWQAFAFLLVVCLATSVLFAIAPALTAARVDVQSAIKEAGGSSTLSGLYGRIRDGLVVVEVALAFVLALGAAIVIREVIRLQRVDAGMNTRNVLTLHLTPRASAEDYYAIEQRVASLPGVQGAGFTQLVPLQNWGWTADFSISGRPTAERRIAGLRYVTPGYFRAMGIPIVRGRNFQDSDTESAPRVVLVNDALASQYFPGEDPVGRALDRGTIVGVVGSVRQIGLDRPAEPEIYYAAAQNLTMAPDIGMSLAVRTSGSPEAATASVRAAVREIKPAIAIFNVKTMEQVVQDSLWELNLYRWLIGMFAGLALLLAAIGLYGVISYNVTSRTREFAVRLALGSDPGGLARLVLRRALGLAGAGLAGGIAVALSVTLLAQDLPIPVRGGAAMYTVISALLLGLAAIACVVPAARVTRVNAAAALRHD